MATESAVTTEGAHPFNTGSDLCLVHNGSLSNHNDLRKWLFKEKGIVFQTENDSEVAAGYISYKMEEGLSLKEALENALDDLDGFYTFAVGTKNGFANQTLAQLSFLVNIPIIASGGAGKIEDLYDAIIIGSSDAVLAASIFHYGEISIKEVKQFFKSKGIPVRL